MNLNQYEKEMIQILREGEIGTLVALHAVQTYLIQEAEYDKKTWGDDSWQYVESKYKLNKFVQLMSQKS